MLLRACPLLWLQPLAAGDVIWMSPVGCCLIQGMTSSLRCLSVFEVLHLGTGGQLRLAQHCLGGSRVILPPALLPNANCIFQIKTTLQIPLQVP